MSQPFPSAFRDLLAAILRRAPDLTVARQPEARGRRRFRGQSGTFAGHRAYTPGDDLRFVDWNAYARTGELFMKLLEEEERRTITICLDCTASMTAGEPMRLVAAQRLAAILGGLALSRLDGVCFAGGAEPVTLHGPSALPRWLEVLSSVATADQQPLALLRTPLERGWQGTVLLISDFAQPDAVAPALALLRRHGLRCRGWLPQLREDVDPPHDGWLRFVDPETAVVETIEVDAALREAMRRELATLRRHQSAVFAAAGYPLIRFAVPAEGDFRMASWFQLPWNSGI